MSRDGDLRESVTLSLAERLGRRGFIRKLTLGAMGLAAAIAGIPSAVQAAGAGLVNIDGCNLCNNPAVTCTGRCCWSWAVCHIHKIVLCTECYNSRTCGPTCPSKCSSRTIRSIPC